MAENDIVIGVKIETGEAAKSLKQLKAEYKDQQKALEGLTVGTAEYVNQLKKLGATKDDIGDLNQTIKSFNPEGKVQSFASVISGVASGFQAATSAAALFGVESKGVQEALLKVQAASGLAEGVKGVVAMGDSFRQLAANLQTTAIGQKVVAIGQKIVTAGQWLWNAAISANPIGLLIIGITALVGAFALLSSQEETAAEKQARLNELEKEQLAQREKDIDLIKHKAQLLDETKTFELDLAKATGKSNEELYKIEHDNIQKRIDDINLLKYYRVNGQLNAAEILELNKLHRQKSLLEIKYETDSKNEIEKLGEAAAAAKKVRDDKAAAAKKIIDDKTAADAKKLIEDRAKAEEDLIGKVQVLKDEELLRLAQSEEKKLEIIRDRQKKELQDVYDNSNKTTEAQKALQEGLLAIDGVYNEGVNALNADKADKKKQQDQKDIDDAKKVADAKLAAAKALMDAEFELTKQSIDSAQVLTDIAFKNKLEGVKKGSKEEEAILRKQFEVNKAFQIANAIVNGIQGVMAITTIPDITFGVTTALRIASQVALTATSIAKIAATKFGGGGGGSIGGGSVAAGSQGATINAPSRASTMINADGTVKQQAPSQKVYVVESDISTKQKTVATIEENAKV
jgi:hypothetical protein